MKNSFLHKSHILSFESEFALWILNSLIKKSYYIYELENVKGLSFSFNHCFTSPMVFSSPCSWIIYEALVSHFLSLPPQWFPAEIAQICWLIRYVSANHGAGFIDFVNKCPFRRHSFHRLISAIHIVCVQAKGADDKQWASNANWYQYGQLGL